MLSSKEIHTAEPLKPEPSSFQLEIGIKKLKSYKSPGTGQIREELMQAQGNILRSVIRKLIDSSLNKEELAWQWNV
jgi:hypothetical protein